MVSSRSVNEPSLGIVQERLPDGVQDLVALQRLVCPCQIGLGLRSRVSQWTKCERGECEAGPVRGGGDLHRLPEQVLQHADPHLVGEDQPQRGGGQEAQLGRVAVAGHGCKC